VLLRLFAPFLPFVTEEVWSWWKDGSVHTSAWPSRGELDDLVGEDAEERRIADQRIYDWATEVLFEVRKQRSEAKQPMRVAITKVTIKAPDAAVSQLMRHVEADLKAALRVKTFETVEGEPSEFLVAGYEP
jgi:valyl-tRNA synthetase